MRMKHLWLLLFLTLPFSLALSEPYGGKDVSSTTDLETGIEPECENLPTPIEAEEIYETPSLNHLRMYNLAENIAYGLKIYNLLGKSLYTVSIITDGCGMLFFAIDKLQIIPNGMYLMQVSDLKTNKILRTLRVSRKVSAP